MHPSYLQTAFESDTFKEINKRQAYGFQHGVSGYAKFPNRAKLMKKRIIKDDDGKGHWTISDTGDFEYVDPIQCKV